MFKKAPAPAKMLGSNAPGSSSGSPALARTSNNRVITACDLYCCLLPVWSFAHLLLGLSNRNTTLTACCTLWMGIQLLDSKLTLSCPVWTLNWAVRAKTTGLHLALQARNSGAESGRELFKGLKDVASLLVYTWKNFFGCGVRIFVSDVLIGGLLSHLGPQYLALGSNR